MKEKDLRDVFKKIDSGQKSGSEYKDGEFICFASIDDDLHINTVGSNGEQRKKLIIPKEKKSLLRKLLGI